MILRTILQFLRVIIFLKNQQKAQLTALKMIDFSQLAEAKDNNNVRQEDNMRPSHITEENDERFNFMRHNESDMLHSKKVHRLDLSEETHGMKDVN
mmetsp:Transcript_30637/g.30265  ORF Transcript_30637/g.30265 Transcript_30637/m.30265 type:complete len:96 (+) Transcript_30637:413-700(+)